MPTISVPRGGETRFFTIGYEHATQAALVALLAANGVTLLVDVRELANSRRVGFSKRSLAAALGEAGIGYLHLKALGTPKAGRQANQRGDMAAFWPIVEVSLARPEAELAFLQLADLAAAQPTALLCLETDWTRCHRARIADRLARERGMAAIHLTPHS